jgi:hypothetical protein
LSNSISNWGFIQILHVFIISFRRFFSR